MAGVVVASGIEPPVAGLAVTARIAATAAASSLCTPAADLVSGNGASGTAAVGTIAGADVAAMVTTISATSSLTPAGGIAVSGAGEDTAGDDDAAAG